MMEIKSSDDLLQQLKQMNKDHSVSQFFIPGTGKFTVILQEEDKETSIDLEVSSDAQLKKMIHDSREAYKKGNVMDTTDIIKSFSPK